MIKINLQQGTQEWLDLRKTKIGASDASIINGTSPYKTVYQLWLEKTGRAQPKQMNAAMSFGHQKEEEIRQHYEEKTGEIFAPCVVQHPVVPYDCMIASLDGASIDEKIIIEIKVCNLEVWEQYVMKNCVPDYYYDQAQHQLACSPETKVVIFIFYNPTKNQYMNVEVFPDEKHKSKIMRQNKEFYEHNMLGDEAPEMTEDDFLDMSDDQSWKCLAERLIEIHPQLKGLKDQEDFLKKQLTELTDDGNAFGHGVKLTRCDRKGSIDFTKMKEDGIDIEKYRKPQIGYVKVTVTKKE